MPQRVDPTQDPALDAEVTMQDAMLSDAKAARISIEHRAAVVFG